MSAHYRLLAGTPSARAVARSIARAPPARLSGGNEKQNSRNALAENASASRGRQRFAMRGSWPSGWRMGAARSVRLWSTPGDRGARPVCRMDGPAIAGTVRAGGSKGSVGRAGARHDAAGCVRNVERITHARGPIIWWLAFVAAGSFWRLVKRIARPVGRGRRSINNVGGMHKSREKGPHYM